MGSRIPRAEKCCSPSTTFQPNAGTCAIHRSERTDVRYCFDFGQPKATDRGLTASQSDFKRWRLLDGPNIIANIIPGAKFVDGIREDKVAAKNRVHERNRLDSFIPGSPSRPVSNGLACFGRCMRMDVWEVWVAWMSAFDTNY